MFDKANDFFYKYMNTVAEYMTECSVVKIVFLDIPMYIGRYKHAVLVGRPESIELLGAALGGYRSRDTTSTKPEITFGSDEATIRTEEGLTFNHLNAHDRKCVLKGYHNTNLFDTALRVYSRKLGDSEQTN